MKKILVALLLSLLPLLPLRAYAADCSSSSAIQSAINAASSGDTLTCASGGTWTSAVSIPNTKGITLDGNGVTVIRQNVGNAALITMVANASVSTIITGFTFRDQSSAFEGYSARFIKATGSPSTAKYRIYNNTFIVENPYCGMIRSHIVEHGQANGLVDNNTFYFSTASEVIHNEAYGTGSDTGWTYDVVPGSEDAMYVENNTFINEPTCYWLSGGKIYAGSNSALQTYYGARTVFRYNDIYHAKVDQHGTPGMVGGRWLEAYENNFYGVDPYSGNTGSIDTLFAMRGGSGVIFNNVYTVNGNACNTGVKSYEEDTGTYPLAYQPGRGKLTGGTFALDPIRIWSNTFTGCTAASSGNTYVAEDRDYYYSADDADARAGYTAYTYPHPLTGETGGGPDTTPAAFSFTDNVNVPINTVIYSDSITVTAIDNDTTIAISGTGCAYQVNGAGDWLTSGDNVVLNDTVALRVTSSPNYSTARACTLTLGGTVSDTWYVTTIAAQAVNYVPIPPRMRAHLRQSPTGYTPPADPGYVGHILPTAAQSVSESPYSNNAWTSPEAIYSAGEASITAATFDAGDRSYILKAYSFNLSSIPDGATIDGVEVIVNARYANAVVDISLAQLLDISRAKVGTNQYTSPQALTTSAADYAIGGATDAWGNALTAAWVKDPDFGVALGFTAGSSGNSNNDVFVDSVTMKVWYTP